MIIPIDWRIFDLKVLEMYILAESWVMNFFFEAFISFGPFSWQEIRLIIIKIGGISINKFIWDFVGPNLQKLFQIDSWLFSDGLILCFIADDGTDIIDVEMEGFLFLFFDSLDLCVLFFLPSCQGLFLWSGIFIVYGGINEVFCFESGWMTVDRLKGLV